jgi:hypothetical protein
MTTRSGRSNGSVTFTMPWDGIVKVSSTRLEDEPREKQETCDVEQGVDDVGEGIVH